MDANEPEGFFPEREVLRLRRSRAVIDEPPDPAAERTRRSGTWMWMVLTVVVFLPMFINTITLGWHGRIPPSALAVLLSILSLLLVGCGVLVGVGLWRSLRHAKDPRPSV